MLQHLKDHLEQGRHIPGIIEITPNMSMGETMEELLLIQGASEIEDYQDLIVYLPISR